MEAFADVVRAGKALYIGVSEWTPEQLRAGHALARELKIPFISNQSKYNALYRVIEPEVVPTCEELGIGQICFSPIEQGLLSGKYQPGQPVPQHSRATDSHGAQFIKEMLTDELLTRVQQLATLADNETSRWPRWLLPGLCKTTTSHPRSPAVHARSRSKTMRRPPAGCCRTRSSPE